MCFKVMLFDLDETLYPPATGIWQAIGERMDHYIVERLAIAPAQVTSLRNDLFHQYGTTMRGLREVYGIDEGEFLAYVHDIPIERYLRKDESLIQMLGLFPQPKVIFTNADTGHARRVLRTLEIEHFFTRVIDIQAIHPYCKPMSEAFQLALELAGIDNPSECVMIDDSDRNLLTAHELGLFTIRIGTEERAEHVDAAILSIHQLPDVIPVSG
jgi:pyrimidine 5'-nucleotidase